MKFLLYNVGLIKPNYSQTCI